MLAATMFYCIGFYMVYRVNLRAIKREMKTAIASGRYSACGLAVIEVDLSSASSIKNIEIEDEKEIRYKGEMYDIVKVSWQDNRLIFTCLHDKNETELAANYTKWLQAAGDKETKKPLQLLKYSFPDYTIATTPSLESNQRLKRATKYTLFLSHISTGYLNTSSPPPWPFHNPC
jgi:hypothetical protein